MRNPYKFPGQIHSVDKVIHEGDLEVTIAWGDVVNRLARKAIRNKSGITTVGPLVIRWVPKAKP